MSALNTIVAAVPLAPLTPVVASAGGGRVLRAREPRVDVRNLAWLVRKEMRDAVRNRWMMLYAVAFTLLSLAVASGSQLGTGMDGLAGYGKTSASLINVVMLFVPLMGLTLGVTSLAGERERGSLAYFLAQPVGRTEVYLAKYLGQSISFLAAIALGFGATAGMIAFTGAQGGRPTAFLWLAGLSGMLGLSMLAIGSLIAAVVRRAGSAMGTAIFTWLALAFLSDLGLMGASVAFRLRVQDILGLSMLNPGQVFKLASLSGFEASLDVLGPVGLYAQRLMGEWMRPAMIGVLGLWIVLPLGAGLIAFRRRPL
jgi:Cu-processing system permease protein